jgi:COP9 signalosome complex subunit 5
VKNVPQFGAYRVYRPEFTPPADETPDGKMVADDKARVERWGSSWNR